MGILLFWQGGILCLLVVTGSMQRTTLEHPLYLFIHSHLIQVFIYKNVRCEKLSQKVMKNDYV